MFYKLILPIQLAGFIAALATLHPNWVAGGTGRDRVERRIASFMRVTV
jgi:hypothetical protein